jgi:hypothetical protein
MVKDIDCGTTLVCDSIIDIEITLPAATGRKNFELTIMNVNTGVALCNGLEISKDSHAHVSNAIGVSWAVVIGGGVVPEETDPLFSEWITNTPPVMSETDPEFSASPARGINNEDITNWNNKLSSESDPVFNSWLSSYLAGHFISAETGEPLIQRSNLQFVGAGVEVTDDGELHTTVVTIPVVPLKYQQWIGFPDSPRESLNFPYQMIANLGELGSPMTFLLCYDVHPYAETPVYTRFSVYMLQQSGWTELFSSDRSYQECMFNSPTGLELLACNFDVYEDSTYGILVASRLNDVKIFEPLTDGDINNPELLFDASGDIIMGCDYQRDINAIISQGGPF